MRRHRLLPLALTCLCANALLAQTHPNLERGLNAGKTYQIGEVDTVNLFNGNLSLSIPLGQPYSVGGGLSYAFVLRYNSNVWDHSLQTFGDDEPPACPLLGTINLTETVPNEYASGLNAGLGWSINFGALLHSGFGTQWDTWTYVAPDGSTHSFYPTLHDGEQIYFDPASGRATHFYTRDGSYMRLVASTYSPGPGCETGGWLSATVEFAGGRTQAFSRLFTCESEHFALDLEYDRFGNEISFTREYANNRLVIQDTTGRTHFVKFKTLAGFEYQGIDHVDLAAFGGTLARYAFTYKTADIARSYKHTHLTAWDPPCDAQLNPTITMSFLTKVLQPDGSEWTMLKANGTDPGYNLDAVPSAPGTPRDRPGTINHLKNPVGGTYDWTYATWRNPEGGASCYSSPYELDSIKDSTGVYDRTLTDPFNASGTGLWQYRHDSHLADGMVDPSAQESWTTVTSPEGDQSKHYFRTQYCGEGAYEGWDYGLPYTKGRDGTLPEPWVSSQLFDVSASLPKKLMRTSFLRYEPDALNASWRPSRLQQSNRRVNFERTVFEDDPNAPPDEAVKHYTTVNHSDYDGLGHFRVVTNGGDFGSGNTRETTTAYNPFLSYSPPPATPPAEWWGHDSPWVINTYASSKVAEGGSIAKAEACFDWSTGYLWYTRTLKLTGTGGADPVQSTSDVIARRTHTSGDTTREESFGGDTQYVNTGELCSLTLPAAASYRVDNTYQYGSLSSSRSVDSTGSPLSFYLVDRDIDPSTGLVSASRDSAGLATDFVFDTMGRLTWEKPRSSPINGGAWVHHCYTNASTGPAKVDNFWWPNGTLVSPTSCSLYDGLLRYDAFSLDAFGRLSREYRKLFDGTWAQRLTTYNGLGWTTSVSEWQPHLPAVVKKTEYLDFDPFGRPGTIRPPDGAAHDTTLTYLGSRIVGRTVKVGTSRDAGGNIIETPSTTTEEYDRQGRLWKVTEPSGATGSNVTTTYEYDIGGRLHMASTTSGVMQNRLFTYDNRGFLLSEQLPELGSAGNGTVTYSNYDARGHAGWKNDGTRRLTYLFDRAERLTDIKLESGSPVEQRTYATENGAADYRNGKLQVAQRWNFLGKMAAVPVRETYVYGGTGGQVSERTTDSEKLTYRQTFTYNDLGGIESLGYPNDLNLATDPLRTVSYSYAYGFLTAVPGYATSISYHANGMTNQVGLAGSAVVSFGKDPDDMPRPASIGMNGVTPAWDSGTYRYDGAGNVVKIGSDWSYYDLVSRIKQGTTQGGTHRQDFSYDSFGNIVTISTDGGGAQTLQPSATTNQLTGAVYDAAGRMKTWGAFAAYDYQPLGNVEAKRNAGISRSYRYTADGERFSVRDDSGKDLARTVSIRDLGGNVLREFVQSGGAWAWSKDYVWRDGQLLAAVTEKGSRYAILDHLGTVRRATFGSAVVGTHDLYPFGLEGPGGTMDGERMKFAGHERDLEGTLTDQSDDLDYMHARYYNPIIGRFLSPDPVRGNPSEPQSWNLYAYARNNPVTFIDPFGLKSENGNVIAGAEVVAADPAAESVRRFQLQFLAFSMYGARRWQQQLQQGVAAGRSGFQIHASAQANADLTCSANETFACWFFTRTAEFFPGDMLSPEGVIFALSMKPGGKGFELDVPVMKQLAGRGQLTGLRTNPNLRGVDIDSLLLKTPRELQDMAKTGNLTNTSLRQIMKAFEGRNLRK